MKYVNYLLAMCLFICCHFSFAQYSSKSFDWNMDAYEKHAYTNSYGTMPFRILKPTQANSNEKYPLVIMLHGKGEGIGQECTNEHGINECNLLWGGKMHLDSINKYPSYVVFPQTHGGDWLSDAPVNLLTGLMEYLFKTYNIDLDRVYIHGLSGGGKGVWNIAYKYPHLFATIAPMSASGQMDQANKVKFTPIWTIQGEVDTEVREQVSLSMMDALKAKGQKPYYTFNPTTQRQEWPGGYSTEGHPVFTLIPGEGHVVWPHMYNSPTWLQWLYAQKKNKIQVLGRTVIEPGETTTLGISAGFEAYEWSNGAMTNEIVVNRSGTYRVRFLRKAHGLSGSKVWSEWSDPVTVIVSSGAAPEADAGRDVMIMLPENHTIVRGYGAGSHVSYSWTKLEGGHADLIDANTPNLYLSNLQAGTYKFKLTVTDQHGNAANDEAIVYVFDPDAPQKVISFTLVNADNGKDIRDINNGDIITLSSLPSQNINIRANTYPLRVGSVEFMYLGKARNDNVAPYALFGDNEREYYRSKLSPGTYTLSATPYTKYNNAGTKGQGHTVSFTVVSNAKMAAHAESAAKMNAQVSESPSLSVYPNPFTGESFNMNFGTKQSDVRIWVYDQMGNLLNNSKIYVDGDMTNGTITIPDLQPGIYRLKVESDKISKMITVVKK